MKKKLSPAPCFWKKRDVSRVSVALSGAEPAFQRCDLLVPQVDAFFFLVGLGKVGNGECYVVGEFVDVDAEFKVGFRIFLVEPFETNEYAVEWTGFPGGLLGVAPVKRVGTTVAHDFVGKPVGQAVGRTDKAPNGVGRGVIQVVLDDYFLFCHIT